MVVHPCPACYRPVAARDRDAGSGYCPGCVASGAAKRHGDRQVAP